MPQVQLNQIIAVEKGVKSRAYQRFTAAHHDVAKAAPLAGITRTYQPRQEDGEQLPSEGVRVQTRVTDVIADVTAELTRLFDVTLTKDAGNTLAKADIIVDGVTLATDVPCTHLLFLEKQLSDLHAFVSNLPVLDPAETWAYDAAADAFATPPVQTVRSKKVPRNHVKAPPTDKHPAQVEMYFEDVAVGMWTTIKFSGALPQKRVTELRARVAALTEAVKTARERANTTPVDQQRIGEALFGFLFA